MRSTEADQPADYGMVTEAGNRTAIVIGILLSKDRKQVLLARRPDKVHLGGLWEFPGGKQSPEESADEALARELKEEIGIEIEDSRRLKCIDYDYPDRELAIDARVIEKWSGEINARERQKLAWTPVRELVNIDFPAANSSIIRALLLSDVYFITPDLDKYDDCFLDRIRVILESGTGLLRFRSTNLTGRKREYYANKILELCRQHNCNFIYDGTPEQAIRLRADGIHLPASRLIEITERPLGTDYYVAASCHTREEIEKANAINADFCVLAPVKTTPSHPRSLPLGWEMFSRICETARLPVYALGGMQKDDLEMARRHGAHGIAMISGVWNG